MTTRAEADTMALRFLSENGPHTLPNPCDTEEAICAALVFLELEKDGLVSRTDFGHGNVQFAITERGSRRLVASPRSFPEPQAVNGWRP